MDTSKVIDELGEAASKIGLLQTHARRLVAGEELRYQAFHGLMDDARQGLNRIAFAAETVQGSERDAILKLVQEIRDNIDSRFNLYIQAREHHPLAYGSPLNPDEWHDAQGNQLYLLQDSRSFVGNDVLWWRPGGNGYTCQIDEAGLFSAEFCASNSRETDIPRLPQDVIPLMTRVVDMQRLSSAKKLDLRKPSAQTIVEKAAEVFTVQMTVESLKGFSEYLHQARTKEPPFSFVADIPHILSVILSANLADKGWTKLIYDKDERAFWLGDGIGVRVSIPYPRLARAIGLAIEHIELCGIEEWISYYLSGKCDGPAVCHLTGDLAISFHEYLETVVAMGIPVRLEASGGKVRAFDAEVNSANLSAAALNHFLKVIGKFKQGIFGEPS